MDSVERLSAQAEALVARASRLLAAGGPTAANRTAIADEIRRLGAEYLPRDTASLASLHGSGAAATVLARAPEGPVLMLARFPADAPTPVHNHNSWGIVCVIAGRDRYLRWTRLDDGSDPDRARLVVAETKELGPGDTEFIDDPPGDIHSQQGIDGPVWELVLFGRDPDAAPRTYFEPETGALTYASSAR